MQFLISVIDDQTGSATPEEMAAIDAFNERSRRGPLGRRLRHHVAERGVVIDNRGARLSRPTVPCTTRRSTSPASGSSPRPTRARGCWRSGSRACNRRVARPCWASDGAQRRSASAGHPRRDRPGAGGRQAHAPRGVPRRRRRRAGRVPGDPPQPDGHRRGGEGGTGRDPRSGTPRPRGASSARWARCSAATTTLVDTAEVHRTVDEDLGQLEKAVHRLIAAA